MPFPPPTRTRTHTAYLEQDDGRAGGGQGRLDAFDDDRTLGEGDRQRGVHLLLVRQGEPLPLPFLQPPPPAPSRANAAVNACRRTFYLYIEYVVACPLD